MRRKTYSTNCQDNLSVILSIGYRVRSFRGTQFRKWATAHLQEYFVKGFVMDDAHLKQPATFHNDSQIYKALDFFENKNRIRGASHFILPGNSIFSA